MRSRKIRTWGGSLALGSLAMGGLLFWALASQAQAPATADLCIPPVVSFCYVMVRIQATGAGPLGDGTWFPSLTFSNGASAGAIWHDSTDQHKLLQVFFGPDGVTPTSEVLQDFTAQLQWNYNYQTGACTQSALSLSEAPVCIANGATELGSEAEDNGHWDIYTATTSPGHFVYANMEQNSLSKPFYVLWRDGANSAEMRIINFSAAPIPPSQFNLPANCGS